MMAYDACVMHRAVRLHFTSDDYDYFRYNGKVTLKGVHFDKDPARWDYLGLSKAYTNPQAMLDFFVANLYENPEIYIKTLTNDHGTARDKYLEHVAAIENIEYNFHADLFNLENKYGVFGPHLFKGGNPPILEAAQSKIISRYTFIALDDILKFTDVIAPEDTIIWPMHKKRLRKFAAFVAPRYDKKKLFRILKDRFTET